MPTKSFLLSITDTDDDDDRPFAFAVFAKYPSETEIQMIISEKVAAIEEGEVIWISKRNAFQYAVKVHFPQEEDPDFQEVTYIHNVDIEEVDSYSN